MVVQKVRQNVVQFMRELKNLSIDDLMDELLYLGSEKEKNIDYERGYRRVADEIYFIKQEIIRRIEEKQ